MVLKVFSNLSRSVTLRLRCAVRGAIPAACRHVVQPGPGLTFGSRSSF